MKWSDIPEAGSALGIRILLWIARTLGRFPFRVSLFVVLLWFYPKYGLARRASMEYLKRLYEFSGGKTPRANFWNSFRHFFAFSENILDKLLAGEKKSLKTFYEGNGAERVKALLDEKKGAIFVTAHFGNLEISRELFQNKRHVPISFFGYIEHAAGYNNVLKKMGLQVHMLDAAHVGPDTAIILSQRLEEGGFVVIAGDRTPVSVNSRTVTVNFLGKPAKFPASPYHIASALGCPVFATFGRREGKHYHMDVEPIAEKVVLPRKDRQQAIEAYVKRYAELLEAQCLEAPLQWMNFYPFWEETKEG
jgi:predicted LPLAT superfamily acyltransferase